MKITIFAKISAVIIFALLNESCSSIDGQINAKIQKAKEFYSEQYFEKSEVLLLQVARESGVNAELFYNLGCAFFRQKKIGLAIAAWKSGLLLSPRDPDLKHNLLVAFKLRKDVLPELEKTWLTIVFSKLIAFFSLDEWLYLLLGSFWIYALMDLMLIIKSRFSSKIKPFKSAGFFFALVCLMGSTQSCVHTYERYAVITEPEVEIYSAPDRAGQRVTILHEGWIVQILNPSGTDQEILLENGWRGFVPQNALQEISNAEWKEAGR